MSTTLPSCTTPLAMLRAMSLPKLRHGAIIVLTGQHRAYEFRKANIYPDTDGVLCPVRNDEWEIHLDNPTGGSHPVDMLTPSSLRMGPMDSDTDETHETLNFSDMEFMGYAYHMYDLSGGYINTAVCYDDVHFLAEIDEADDEDYDHIRVATLAPGSRFPPVLNLRDTLTPELRGELLHDAAKAAATK